MEQLRALPWYEHDSIMECVVNEFGEEPEHDLSTLGGLAEAGFDVREVG